MTIAEARARESVSRDDLRAATYAVIYAVLTAATLVIGVLGHFPWVFIATAAFAVVAFLNLDCLNKPPKYRGTGSRHG